MQPAKRNHGPPSENNGCQAKTMAAKRKQNSLTRFLPYSGNIIKKKRSFPMNEIDPEEQKKESL